MGETKLKILNSMNDLLDYHFVLSILLYRQTHSLLYQEPHSQLYAMFLASPYLH